jgi:hypothetical protein
VDGADYVLWREGGTLQNETVTPGSTTIEDFNVWRASFGNVAAPGPVGGAAGAGAVPEPASALLGLGTGLGVVCAYFFRRIRGR